MIDVVVDQPPLRFGDRLLDRMQLLGELDAAAALVEHFDDAPHMPLGTLEALDDVAMRSVNVCLRHARSVSYRGGYAKQPNANARLQRRDISRLYSAATAGAATAG